MTKSGYSNVVLANSPPTFTSRLSSSLSSLLHRVLFRFSRLDFSAGKFVFMRDIRIGTFPSFCREQFSAFEYESRGDVYVLFHDGDSNLLSQNSFKKRRSVSRRMSVGISLTGRDRRKAGKSWRKRPSSACVPCRGKRGRRVRSGLLSRPRPRPTPRRRPSRNRDIRRRQNRFDSLWRAREGAPPFRSRNVRARP